MKVKIFPSRPVGEVNAPASKSAAHRLLIAAALADGVSVIRGVPGCDDVRYTLGCIEALGVRYELFGDSVRIFGSGGVLTPVSELYAGESGSTLRFMIPILFTLSERSVIKGAKRLFERPLSEYEKIAAKNGLTFVKGESSLTVRGKLKPGIFELNGNVSSQFITGLLFALPMLDGDSEIRITTPLESASYVTLTLKILEKFGIHAEWRGDTIRVNGNQRYKPLDITVEGDWSGAAFLDALTYLGGDVRVMGLNQDTAQGDSVYPALYERLGHGYTDIDITDCPDLAPILFALAAELGGAGFTGTARLKIKESDRAEAMRAELSKLGAGITVEENSVTVNPATLHAPSEPIFSHNDHRIVMSLAALLTKYGGEIVGAEAVNKSYPDFFHDLASLGVRLQFEE